MSPYAREEIENAVTTSTTLAHARDNVNRKSQARTRFSDKPEGNSEVRSQSKPGNFSSALSSMFAGARQVVSSHV